MTSFVSVPAQFFTSDEISIKPLSGPRAWLVTLGQDNAQQLALCLDETTTRVLYTKLGDALSETAAAAKAAVAADAEKVQRRAAAAAEAEQWGAMIARKAVRR